MFKLLRLFLAASFLLSPYWIWAKTPQALKSFDEIHSMNPFMQYNYIKSLGIVLKIKKFPFYNQTLIHKQQNKVSCFYGFFTLKNKCELKRNEVMRFFSRNINKTKWEELRFNVQSQCIKAKKCNALKRKVEQYFTTAQRKSQK